MNIPSDRTRLVEITNVDLQVSFAFESKQLISLKPGQHRRIGGSGKGSGNGSCMKKKLQTEV